MEFANWLGTISHASANRTFNPLIAEQITTPWLKPGHSLIWEARVFANTVPMLRVFPMDMIGPPMALNSQSCMTYYSIVYAALH